MAALDMDSETNRVAMQSGIEELNQCVTRDEEGRPTLQLTLPDDDSLQSLAASFAKFAALTQPTRK